MHGSPPGDRSGAPPTSPPISTSPSTPATDASGVAGLRFDNRFVRELPADPVRDGRVRQVLGACYSHVHPTPAPAPKLVAAAREVAASLGLSEADCETPAFVDTFAGNRLLPGMEPYAACYGGHQFGSWAGQLGDGRAITLGEAITPNGERLELQLKGAGRTPYSRQGDGRAVLRSSIREFLCSEAMHHLGVPTTRALSVITSGDQVMRDILYDGNPRPEPGAVVCRVAPSFLRFGNFEIFAARRDFDSLRVLADHTIRTHFPELLAQGGAIDNEVYARWFEEVCRRTATLMVHWMRVGFVHGVMNTDNMSILGLTIDYGPYGWLEGYDPGWTPNITDAGGRRYRYGAQPRVALWNLVQLANALVPLTEDVERFQRALETYAETFEREHLFMMAAKLGLVDAGQPDARTAGERETDKVLTEDLFDVLTLVETDMTLFFRALAALPLADGAGVALRAPAALDDAYYVPLAVDAAVREKTTTWLEHYAARARALPDAERARRMNAVNPKYVLRNYLAQLAIDDAERGDFGKVRELLEVLRRPYDEQPTRANYAEKRPDWARNRAGCSMLSCSS
ncbi:MAG TPA: YdiU family protein [Polyangia bacterium]